MEGEVVLVKAKATDSSTIVVSVGSTSVQTVFTPPRYLKNGHRLRIGNGESGNVLFIRKYSSG